MSSQAEDIAAKLIIDLDDPALTSANVVAGAKKLFLNQATPRIVVCPVGGPVIAPDNPGHQVQPDGTKSKILLHRQCQYRVYCMGQSEDQTEIMLHQVLRVLRNRYLTGLQNVSEEWQLEDANNDAFTFDGSCVIVKFSLTIPVRDAARTLTLLEADPPILGEDLWGENETDVTCYEPPEDP